MVLNNDMFHILLLLEGFSSSDVSIEFCYICEWVNYHGLMACHTKLCHTIW